MVTRDTVIEIFRRLEKDNPALIWGMCALIAAAVQSKSRNPIIIAGLMQSLPHADAVSPFINATQCLENSNSARLIQGLWSHILAQRW